MHAGYWLAFGRGAPRSKRLEEDVKGLLEACWQERVGRLEIEPVHGATEGVSGAWGC